MKSYMSRLRHRLDFQLMAISVILLSTGAALAQPAGSADVTDPANIQKWIDQLDSDVYLVRERAMKRLASAGSAALIPLAKAADDGERLEVSTRAVRLLMQLTESRDTEASVAALTQIAQLQNRPVERSAAASILHGMREKRAYEKIIELGGEEKGRYTVDGKSVLVGLHLGKDWKGGDDGLRHVKEMSSLQMLTIHGTPVTDAGIAHLKGLKDFNTLTMVQIYGTRATEAGVDELRQALTEGGRNVNLKVIFRHGALLGVYGAAHPGGGAQILTVQPDSAAARAGMQVHDVVKKFNGNEVKDFEGLTDFIAKLKPGEKATLDWDRGNQTFSKEVSFGGWE